MARDRKPGAAHPKGKAGLSQTDAAESVAIQALGFLAGDPERLGLFLSLTGVGPESLRTAAATPEFLSAVLDHMISDDTLLLDFAAASSFRPEDVVRAQAVLGHRPWERDIP